MTEIGRIGKCTSIMDTSLTATLPKINGFPYEGQELLSTEEKPTYRLLLIGKIGNGKSATGNTLLEKPAFQISSSLEYKRASIRKGFRELHNYNIEVVEAPGLDIMQFRDIDQMSYTFSLFYKAIALESEGFDAILLVLRFGNVFESQDIESIKFFKLILGQDFIKNHCIIVFTCGDLFKKEKDSFKKWLFQQKGEFKKLVDECERRVVLFDNETKLESEKSKQVSKLIKMVDLLKTNNYKYSLENYTLANDGRSRLFLKLFSNNYSNKLFKYSSCFNGENELYNMNLYPAKKRSSHNAEVSFMKRLKSYITEAVKHNFKNVSDLKYKDETPQKVVFVETASELDNTSQDYSFNDKKVTQQNNDNENLHCHVLLHEAPF